MRYGLPMREGPDISRVASAIGDPARASMVTALLRLPAMTAGELAREAGVTPQTASGHLRRLEDANLVVVAARGRHRYYGLSGDRAAQLIEELLGFSANAGVLRTRPGPKDAAMRRARTCYNHLAGEVAVGLFERLEAAGALVQLAGAMRLSEVGRTLFAHAGIPLPDGEQGRAVTCRACLDWSERQPHLGGKAGSLLLQKCLDAQWLQRSGREVLFTRQGEAVLDRLFERADYTS